MKNKIIELSVSYKQKIIEDIQKLVQIPSVLEPTEDYIFGSGIKESLHYVLNRGAELGFSTVNVDDYAGHIEYGQGAEILGVLCHVDVVPADGDWVHGKFAAQIEDNRIYGRGTSDDKGPTICSLYAMKILKDLGFMPNKRVRLIIGTDEETAWRGIEHYLAKVDAPSLGFSPDADFPLIYGEKGIMSLDLESSNDDKNLKSFVAGSRYNVVAANSYAVFNLDLDVTNTNIIKEKTEDGYKYVAVGKSAHAMEPDKGINAGIILAQFLAPYTTNKLVKFIASLTDSRLISIGLNVSTEPMGDLTMNVGIININDKVGMAGLNFRYPNGMDDQQFICQFKEKAEGINVVVKENKHPHFVSPDSKLVKDLHEAYIDITNDTTTPIKTIGGGTYARAIKNAVAFGTLFPNEAELAHEPDEYIAIDSAIKATAIIANAIYKLTR